VSLQRNGWWREQEIYWQEKKEQLNEEHWKKRSQRNQGKQQGNALNYDCSWFGQ